MFLYLGGKKDNHHSVSPVEGISYEENKVTFGAANKSGSQ